MSTKKTISPRVILTFFLAFAFIFANISDMEAARRKKRSYNPNKTRQQAIEIIRSTSEQVSELAGLEPKISDEENSEINELINDDGEILTVDGDIGEDLEELETEDDVTVDLDDFKMMWLSFIDSNEGSDVTAAGISKSDLMYIIMDWLGTPYRFGGTTRRNVDCSGFTQKIFLAAADIMIPRVAREQVNIGDKINRKNLEFGDMVFFHTYSRRFASHVGIYLGDNLFAHASSRHGVTVSSLESSYYKKNFIGGRRINARDVANYSINKNSTQLNATDNPSKQSQAEKSR
ncbi:MAG: C40 family peptidase [Candidatus Kapabacteria bacterium]|nr:C40 family peptidase [Ignavibacteriota bacterium]MCW5884952.1 C40 family peptidase [Candidatus Kapabacteria bacterium]